MSKDYTAKNAIILIDPAANLNFICTQLATDLGLTPHSTTIFLKVIGEEFREKTVDIYQFGVQDKHGGVHWMEAVAVPTISTATPLPNPEAALQLFPEAA